MLVRSGSSTFDLGIQPRARTAGESIAWLRVSAQSAFGRPALYGLPASIPWLGLGDTRYRAPLAPEPIGRFAAAVLMHGRAAAEREAAHRRRNGHALATALAALRTVSPVRIDGAPVSPGFLRFPARVSGGFSGLAAHDRLARLGVAPSYPKTLAGLPAVSNHLVAPDRRFAGAETLARELVTLPTHSLLTDRGRQHMLRLLDTREPAAR